MPKGNTKPHVPLALHEEELISVFPLGSVHLLFLKGSNGPYTSCSFRDPSLRLSSHGNEKLPEGEATQATIKVLLEPSIEYWDDHSKKEREFLEKAGM